jgi:dephospho-CoA kinase
MAFRYAIVLTGSIATGKSSVAVILKKMGFEIIDADTIAHEILNAQHQQISEIFGEDIVQKGMVNRKALGAIVFSDEQKRKNLEQLLHPLIYKRIEALSEKLDNKEVPYLIDIPLFFETNRYPIKKSLVVYTPLKIQLKRLMQRDNAQKIDAQKRIDTQISIEEKVKRASYVIDNSGTLAELERECLRVKEEILGDF